MSSRNLRPLTPLIVIVGWLKIEIYLPMKSCEIHVKSSVNEAKLCHSRQSLKCSQLCFVSVYIKNSFSPCRYLVAIV